MRGARVVVAVALVAGATGCEADRPTARPPVAPCTSPANTSPANTSPARTSRPAATTSTTTRDIAYASVPGVDPNLLSLDLTVPDPPARCAPVPIVVWVHGGGFVTGDKANGVDDMVRWATAEGWAFASVNHRLSPRAPNGDPDRVRHPTQVDDVADAVGWLVANAAERGIDPDRIVLIGHSAGAFLVSLLATDGRHLAAAGVDLAQVRAVASLDTRYDIAAEVAEGDAVAGAMYRNAFGDDPDTWRDASPLTHATDSDDIPPFVVVTRGQPERVASARTFATALDDGTLLDASPLTHEQVGDALGRPGDTVVTPTVTSFFREALSAGG